MTGENDESGSRTNVATANRTTANGEVTDSGGRVATIRTTHADAGLVAASLAPDDTDSIDARVDGDTVTCTVERPTTGGLRSTVDDYVVNLRIADRVIDRARAFRGANGTHAEGAEPVASDADVSDSDNDINSNT